MSHLAKKLASKNIDPAAALAAIWRDGRDALAELPLIERGLVIFWLLGPFIMLIERTPADIWLSVLALAFVIRAVIRREGDWLKHFWVRAGFAFWFWCLIAAAISPHPAYALGEAAIWFRFPLFAMACAFWLGRDRRLLHLMLASTALGLFAMCDILLLELIIEGQKAGRLTWPYGDTVPGGYIAKVGLPVFAVICALAAGMKNRLAVFLALAIVFVSFMAGERINFLIVICGGALAGLAWRPDMARVLGMGGAGIAVIAGGAWLTGTGARYGRDFISGATDFETSVWWHTLNGGWIVARDNWLTGIGTANYRIDAPRLLDGIAFTKVDPHPHHFYLQMLLETGVIGLALGTVFLWSIVATCWRGRSAARGNVLAATAFVVPFAFFWPLATTGDFFGQWNNCFMWSGVALAISCAISKQR